MIVILCQNIPDVNGCGRHPDHVGIVRIILMYNLLQSGTALKRIVALL